MFNNILKQFLKAATVVAAGTGILLAASNAQAASCTITTTPTPAVITAGESIVFSGNVSGKNPKTYDWTFDGGSPAGSTQQTVAVTYNSPGSFQATLDGTNSSKKNNTCSASITVTVNPDGVNNPPVANDDAYATNQDTQLVVSAPGVLGNDTDADNDPITVDPADVGTGPTSLGGTVTLNSNGSFTYDPPAGVSAVVDDFTYHATDGADLSNIATVSITINAVGGNNAPVANNDAYTTDQDTQLSVSAPGVLGNDTDADNDPITVDPAYVGTGPTSQGGSVTLNSNGSFSYDPAAGFTGNDTFDYAATDGIDTSNVATVTISVNAVGVGPTARGDTYATPVDTTLDVAASPCIRCALQRLRRHPAADSRAGERPVPMAR